METYREGSSAPWRSTVDFREVSELAKSSSIPKRNVDDAMVSQGRHCSDVGALLSTTVSCSRDEDAAVFAPVFSSCPLLTRGVPKCLPLSWEITISGWDANEESVVRFKNGRSYSRDVGLWGCVHLSEYLLWQCLGYPVGKKV